MPLPNTGDLAWGDELNDYIINSVQSTAQSALTGLNTHTTAADPHGDRAYTDASTTAITGLKGAANGYAELGADGKLKALQAPAGGGRTNAYDVQKDYGAVGDGTTNDTTSIQNALNACAAAGGGEVWIPDGTYIVSNLEIKTPGNLWFHLSNGAVVKRRSSSSVQNFITNFNSSTDILGYTAPGQLIISGGTIDGNAANNSTACTLLSLAHASGVIIRDMIFQNVVDYNAIHLCACTNTVVEATGIRGLRIVGSGAGVSPAVKISAALSSSTLPGLSVASYDSTPCFGISISKCMIAGLGSYGSFGSLAASLDDTSSATLVQSNIHVSDNTMLNSNDYAVRAIGWTDSFVSRNLFKNCNGMVSVEVPSSRPANSIVDRNIIVSDNIGDAVGVINNGASILTNAIHGLGRYATGASPVSSVLRGLQITGNEIMGYANVNGIRCLNVADGLIANNIVRDGTDANSFGVLIYNGFYMRVNGNRIATVNKVGVYLGALDGTNPNFACAHATANNNVVTDTGASGISINYSGYVTAVGNNLQNTVTSGIGCFNNTNNSLLAANVGQNCGTHGTQYTTSPDVGTGNVNSATSIG